MMWLQAIHEHRPEISIAPNFAYALVTRRATQERARGLDPLLPDEPATA